MIYTMPLNAQVRIDTVNKTVIIGFTLPAAEGEGDVIVWFRDVTGELSLADKNKLRHLLNKTP